ncbi:MAG: hypothetical protein ACT4TC_24070 [Myxococcaceae bacterium]
MRVGHLAVFFLVCGCSAVQTHAETRVDREQTVKIPAGLEEALIKAHGEGQRARIQRGLKQCEARWRTEDGDLATFAKEFFLSDPQKLNATFARLETVFEQVDGHLNEVGRELRRATDLEIGPLLPVDPLLSGLDVTAHLTEDLFTSKIAFVALLNFPLTTLSERTEQGMGYSRQQWAEARLAGRFAFRIPAAVRQEIAKASATADLYIAQYNVWMHHLLNEKGERLFPKGLRLISHWNLRDELKADYADPRGLEKQRMIVQVMARIVTQTIPAVVIDNPRVDWNPFSNAVSVAPPAEVEANAPMRDAKADAAPEPDVRYQKLLAQFRAAKAADKYSPIAPSAIARSFEISREIPETRVVKLLTDVLTSPLVPKVATLIEKKLGRKLEPADLWFNGFVARGAFKESELDAMTRKRYPNAEAFAKDMPRILTQLGFTPERAKYLAAKIAVEASRGAGHAMQAARRGDLPRLRTRIEPEGMNYKGYNIAVHELGHNVEQVFSLYDVDHTLLAGVPNSAFTEAMAFVFQARDLELLGLAKPDAESERLRVLNDFWQTYEIAGVALVDLAAWHWMYEHPDATPAQLRDAVAQLSKEHWNQFYAPVLGGKDTPMLGIYSHSIAYPLYLSDYPLGHLIAFQVEEHLKKSGPLGAEFERMTKFGSVIPDLWMENATGKPVSAEPLLRATEKALAR